MIGISMSAFSQETGATAENSQIPTARTVDVTSEVLEKCAEGRNMHCYPILAGEDQKSFYREKSFDSWSLFLICSPAMLKQSSAKSLASLFENFSAFSKAIGPDNAAVWFVKNTQTRALNSPKNLDVDRSVQYCSKYQLDRARGPHIVITKAYPELTTNSVTPSLVVNLGGLADKSIEKVLIALTTQVGNEKLDQSSMDITVWMEKLTSACKAAVENIGDALTKVKVSVEAGGAKVSIEPVEKSK